MTVERLSFSFAHSMDLLCGDDVMMTQLAGGMVDRVSRFTNIAKKSITLWGRILLTVSSYIVISFLTF